MNNKKYQGNILCSYPVFDMSYYMMYMNYINCMNYMYYNNYMYNFGCGMQGKNMGLNYKNIQHNNKEDNKMENKKHKSCISEMKKDKNCCRSLDENIVKIKKVPLNEILE